MSSLYLKYFLLIIVSLSIGFFVGAYFMYGLAGVKFKSIYDNNSLYTLSDDIDLMEYVAANFQHNNVIKRKVENMLALQLFTIAMAKPDIDQLAEIPLSALCKTIQFEKSNNFRYVDDLALITPIKSYLANIDNTVKQAMRTQQQNASTVFRKSELKKNRLNKINSNGSNQNDEVACFDVRTNDKSPAVR